MKTMSSGWLTSFIQKVAGSGGSKTKSMPRLVGSGGRPIIPVRRCSGVDATSSAIFCPAMVAVAVIGRYCGVGAGCALGCAMALVACALALVVAAASAMHAVAAPTISRRAGPNPAELPRRLNAAALPRTHTTARLRQIRVSPPATYLHLVSNETHIAWRRLNYQQWQQIFLSDTIGQTNPGR